MTVAEHKWTGTRAPARPTAAPRLSAKTAARHGGLSIMEVITVLTIIGVLLSMSAPSFSRTMEQAHADIAGANLQAIWSAQRYYWLENRTYTTDLTELEALDLLDGSIVAGTSRYSFSITAADDDTFTAAATRTGSVRWTGSLTIDESGLVAGAIQASGSPDITPGLQ